MNAKAIGLVLSFSVFRLLLVHQTSSLAADAFMNQFRTILLQFCGLVAPLIVYRGSRCEPQADEIGTERTLNVEEAPEQT
jgi:hypothetical protein